MKVKRILIRGIYTRLSDQTIKILIKEEKEKAEIANKLQSIATI